MQQFINQFFLDDFRQKPVGMFTKTHLITLLIFLIIIGITIYLLKDIKQRNLTILTRILAVIFVILEIIKIICTLCNGDTALDHFIPLYFCSMFIYALIFAGFAGGTLQKLGTAFIATGSIIAGLSFLIFPTTSFMSYPLFHYFSLHSYIYHSMMIILGILYLINGQYQFTKKEIKYYLIFCGSFSMIAVILNIIFDTNFMFYNNAANIPVKILVTLSNKVPILYTIVVVIGCIGLPYLLSFLIYQLIKYMKKKKV